MQKLHAKILIQCILSLLTIITNIHPAIAQHSEEMYFKDNEPVHNASDSLKKMAMNRKILVGSISAGSLGISFVALNNAWYKNYDRASLRSFNDAKEWLQLDKMGHLWTSYNTANLSFKAWQWAGTGKATSILLGSLTSMSYLSTIEYLDGRSAKWGWSWSDMTANVFGTGVFALQETLSDKQIVRIKLSAHRDRYLPELTSRVDELFGNTLPSRLLKDYNAQTYWLSINLTSILPHAKLPGWLSLAIGTGGQGMLGGVENREIDADGHIVFDRRDIPRYRQWYLSLDLDLSRIKTSSKTLRTVFDLVNVLKIPLPSLEYSQGRVKGYFLYF
ncbi:MAG: DUF2279 domain-containing protein [Citrobacter freundii]|nr:MAG: DUF2279 domain-containing protein [Citrobacter freundii]